MGTINSRKMHSLRSIVFVFLLFGFLGVGALLFVVFHSTVPHMLLQSEDKLLEKQQRSLNGLFDAAMRYTYQMADDTAQFDETASFAEGNNPDFIANNWHEGSPVQNYRMNFLIIKNMAGKDVYSEWHDYLQGAPLKEPPGFSAFLEQYREKALARFYSGFSQNDDVFQRGVGGVFILDGIAYSVAAMPVLRSTREEHPSGVLYMGSVLTDAYFKDITRFDTVRFAIIGTDEQSENAEGVDSMQKSGEIVTSTLKLPSLTGAPIELRMSDRRSLYLSGKEMLDKVQILLGAALLLFAAVLYFITFRFVLRPMALLNSDVSQISEARILEPERYSHSQEFALLCASINDMVERLRQSTTAMDILRIVLNGMESFIYVVDPKTGQLLFVNDTMLEHCRESGIHAVEDEDKTCWQRLRSGLSGPCEGCPIHKLDPSGKPVVWELYNPETGKHFRQTDRMMDWLDGRKVQLHHSLDITRSKLSEERLKKRLEQQSLMADIARSFITAKDTEAFIDNALGMAGTFLELSRLLLIHLADAGNSADSGAGNAAGTGGAAVFTAQAEWRNPERAGLDTLRNSSFLVAHNDSVYHEIAVDKADHAAIASLAEASGHEWLKAHGAKSILVVPVYNGADFWGLLCFDDTEEARNWSRSDIQLGVLIGSIISAVIGRAVTEDALLRMSSIVDSSPQSILLLNRDGVFEYANPGAVTAFGFSQEELVGARFDLVIGQDLGELFKQDIIPTILDGDIPTFDLPVICKNGEERFFNFSAFMTAGKNGGIGVIAFDITDRRALERDIVMAKDQAEASSRAKGDFLSRMSHEMRTPLNAVIGMTHIAKASNDPAKKEYCLDKIDAASVHLLGVINDILDMSKIEADKFELFYADFSFEDMIRRVYDVIHFRVEERKQSLVMNIDPSVPACIEGDEQHLAQVMTNLLSNAVKFTPDDGSISLAVRSLGHDGPEHILEVRVTDTGIGISPEQQARLFTSFEQADGGISRKFGGTGLGLAISRRIVEMMGGEIWIESEEGKGATFIFTFKAKAVLAVKEKDGTAGAAERAPDADTAGIFTGKHVLLAEDNEINREIVLSLLEDTGLVIDTAVDGAEAVDAFASSPSRYRMIFMDIHMPGVDGYEAVRRIRALPVPEASTVPIIAMTANVFREDIDRCLQCGMNGHIAKPIDPAELHGTLAKYLL